MNHGDDIWRRPGKSQHFLDVVRGGIPLAREQIDVLRRVVRAKLTSVNSFLDLGCGDGILGRAVLADYPDAHGVFVDYSAEMIYRAQESVDARQGRTDFIVEDLGSSRWVETVRGLGPFNLVVSGFAIHHQPDSRKRRLYEEVFDLLHPGGVFLNLEHVASKSDAMREAFEQLFMDSLWRHHREMGGSKSIEQLAREQSAQDDHAANILAPLEVQCEWLESIGFIEVDCYFKIFELALFGARRPTQPEQLQ